MLTKIQARILPPEEKDNIIEKNLMYTEWCGFLVTFFQELTPEAIAHVTNQSNYKIEELMEAVELSEDFILDSMPNILSSLGGPVGADENPGKMYVLTNESNRFGAGTIMSRAARKKMSEAFPDGAYLLPSSIHEWLMVEKDSATPEDLLDIVKSINSSIVKGDGFFLADDVFEIIGDGIESALKNMNGVEDLI